MAGRQTQSPKIIIPSRKKLPVISTLTQDAMVIGSKQDETKGDFEQSSQSRQLNSFNDLQSPIAPPITSGLRIEMILNASTFNAESAALVWSQGEIKDVSNRNNLPKEGGWFHKKGLFFGIKTWTGET